jgi:hypothetical protein
MNHFSRPSPSDDDFSRCKDKANELYTVVNDSWRLRKLVNKGQLSINEQSPGTFTSIILTVQKNGVIIMRIVAEVDHYVNDNRVSDGLLVLPAQPSAIDIRLIDDSGLFMQMCDCFPERVYWDSTPGATSGGYNELLSRIKAIVKFVVAPK